MAERKPHKHAAVIHAYADGKTIQVSSLSRFIKLTGTYEE